MGVNSGNNATVWPIGAGELAECGTLVPDHGQETLESRDRAGLHVLRRGLDLHAVQHPGCKPVRCENGGSVKLPPQPKLTGCPSFLMDPAHVPRCLGHVGFGPSLALHAGVFARLHIDQVIADDTGTLGIRESPSSPSSRSR